MHPPVRRSIRRALAAVGGLLVAAALATPASADDPPKVNVNFNEFSIAQGVGPDSSGKIVPVQVKNNDLQQAAQDVTVRIDTTKTAKVLLIELAEPQDGCTTEQGVITCQLADVPADTWWTDVLSLRFRVVPGVEAGTVAKPWMSVSSSNLGTNVLDWNEVTVVDSAPDLVALKNNTINAKAGDRIRVPVGFSNLGDEAAEGISVDFYAVQPRYLRILRGIDGCRYAPLPDNYEAMCTFDGTFEPGRSYRMIVDGEDGLPVDIMPFTPGPNGDNYVYYNVWPGKHGEQDVAKHKMVAGHGLHASFIADMTRKPLAKDADPGDNHSSTSVKVAANPADLAALDARAKGRVGESVRLRVGMRNNGPADTHTRLDGSPGGLFITAPSGTVVTSLPSEDHAECTNASDGKADWHHKKLGRREYFCVPNTLLKVDETRYLSITLRIEDSTVGSDGTLVTEAGTITDPNQANDRARIVVTVLAGSASPSHGTGGHGGSAGGALPVTGGRLGLYAGVGAAVLLVGVGLVLAQRRRRVRD